MPKSQLHESHRRLLGDKYTLVEFQQTYDLQLTEAERLFEKFGPSKRELDLLMEARRNPKKFPSL